jgi:hypothetical protein
MRPRIDGSPQRLLLIQVAPLFAARLSPPFRCSLPRCIRGLAGRVPSRPSPLQRRAPSRLGPLEGRAPSCAGLWRDALRRVRHSANGRPQSRPRRSMALRDGAWPSMTERGPPSASVALHDGARALGSHARTAGCGGTGHAAFRRAAKQSVRTSRPARIRMRETQGRQDAKTRECVLFYFAAWLLCVLALRDSPCVGRLILIAEHLWNRRVAQASRGLIASRLLSGREQRPLLPGKGALPCNRGHGRLRGMRARLVLAYGSMSARPHTRARLPIASQLHNITQARARAPSAAPPPTTAGSGDQLALASSSLLACIRALPGPHASYQRRQEWL